MDGLQHAAKSDAVFIRTRVDQQRHPQVEGARRTVASAARDGHAGEPGLFEQHPGGKPRGSHPGLKIVLQINAPHTSQRPVRKVRLFE